MRRIPCTQCPTHHHCIVRDLTPDQLEDYRAASVCATYRPRQILFHEGAPADGLYFLCLGAVKLFQSDRFGRDHILTVAGPGDVLSELSLDGPETHAVSAEALSECQVSHLSRDALTALLQRHPLLGVRLLSALGRALGAARRKVGELALKRAEGRLAELLLQLSHANDPHGAWSAHVTLAYSRREIAEMIGVSTETAIRLLARLKQKRVIETDHRELVVIDRERLARLANHDAP